MSAAASTAPVKTTGSPGPDVAALRRRVGRVGVVASALIVVQVPLYFVYDGAPPDSNILTRTLIGLVGVTCYLVWFVGLRDLVERAAPAYSWLSGVIHAAGLTWCAMVFVPQSMEAGAAISVDHDIDTTTEGPFAAAQYLMQGAISRLLMAAVLIALGIVVSRTGLLRGWVGKSAFVLAAINLAFVPALYFGDDAAQFYSAQGWGTTASMGALWSLWTLAVSISMVRRARS
jgi:hypothetical protein